MRVQKQEIEELKKLLTIKAKEDLMATKSTEMEAQISAQTEEIVRLSTKSQATEAQLMVFKREIIVMRNMLVIAWIGFAVVMGTIITLLK